MSWKASTKSFSGIFLERSARAPRILCSSGPSQEPYQLSRSYCIDILLIGSLFPNSTSTWPASTILDHFPPLSLWPYITSSACAISVCYKTFNATELNGQLQETAIDEVEMFTFKGDEEHFVPKACIFDGSPYDISEYLDIKQVIESQTSQKAIPNVTAYQDTFIYNTVKNQTLFDVCTFNISTDVTSETLGSTLEGLFEGSFQINGLLKDDGDDSALDPWHSASMTDFKTSPHLIPVFQAGQGTTAGTQQRFHQVTDALTNHIRRNDANDTVIQGTILTPVTVVRVVPEWLILPTVLVIASWIFVGLTISKSQEVMRDKTWKSDPTALIYHGLRDRDRAVDGPLALVKDMENAARQTRIVFGAPDEAGWRLRRLADSGEYWASDDV